MSQQSETPKNRLIDPDCPCDGKKVMDPVCCALGECAIPPTEPLGLYGPGKCEICGETFASRIDGLCALCDADDQLQREMDRDRE